MITVDRREFARALKLAGAVIEKRATVPVMTHAKVVANGALAIEGSDFDCFARAELAYDGEEGGFCLPEPRQILAAINAAGGPAVSFKLAKRDAHEAEKAFVGLQSGALSAELLVLPSVDDHPGAELVGEQRFAATLGSEFFAQLRRVLPAISTEETRYYLNGVYFEPLGDWKYRLTATNGHMLLCAEVALPDGEGDWAPGGGDTRPGVIVPRRMVNLLLDTFAKAKDGTRLQMGMVKRGNEPVPSAAGLPMDSKATRISAASKLGEVTFTLASKLIDGTYPDYRRVIPKDQPYAVRCQRSALVQALQALTPLSDSKMRAVRLSFKPGVITIGLTSAVLGDSSFALPAETTVPADLVVGFNGNYLRDLLQALGGDEVELNLLDAGAPAVFRNPADPSLVAVLMPMRV